jgi:hypothetical protein
MSVEGMWLLRSNEVADLGTVMAPSIIVLETGRLFGGDTAYFFIGSYEADGHQISGTANVKTHTVHPDLENVFGIKGEIEHQVSFHGSVEGDTLKGKMETSMMPGLELDWTMQKLSDLP